MSCKQSSIHWKTHGWRSVSAIEIFFLRIIVNNIFCVVFIIVNDIFLWYFSGIPADAVIMVHKNGTAFIVNGNIRESIETISDNSSASDGEGEYLPGIDNDDGFSTATEASESEVSDGDDSPEINDDGTAIDGEANENEVIDGNSIGNDDDGTAIDGEANENEVSDGNSIENDDDGIAIDGEANDSDNDELRRLVPHASDAVVKEFNELRRQDQDACPIDLYGIATKMVKKELLARPHQKFVLETTYGRQMYSQELVSMLDTGKKVCLNLECLNEIENYSSDSTHSKIHFPNPFHLRPKTRRKKMQSRYPSIG